MDENIYKLYQNRIDNIFPLLTQEIYPQSVPLQAEYARTAEPVPFAQRLELSYQPAEEGEFWGREWESAWFHLSGTIPEEFAGKELCLRLHTGGELLLFDAAGNPLCGLTGHSVFDSNFYKDRYTIGCHAPGEKIEFWAEAAANRLQGIELPGSKEKNPASPLGCFAAQIRHLKLCVFDRELWQFQLDLKVLNDLAKKLGFEDFRGRRLFRLINEALDLYRYTPANAASARRFLAEKAFSLTAAPGALRARAIGHAHIDVGWLWPVRESIRKAARTFASQLLLLKQYPDYMFGASQAELYRMVKENYPALYEKIKQAVRDGRWELQGGMWVESDCSLICGESMVRQFLYGKNFFRDEFGKDVTTVWLPDAFGFAASMPQIIRKSGCKAFLSQKISWSKINRFPHHTFRWKGIDGTEVAAHFLPENSYNAAAMPEQRILAQNRFAENDLLPEFMSLVGIGDGGGGPTEEYIERNMRMKDLDGCPRTFFGDAETFFRELEPYVPQLEVWQGELYLELHRGTLTTQSRTKRGNRKCEEALAALEFFASHLAFADYPAQELDSFWKTLLVNQFHDILPGSSIRLVYERTEQEHQQILSGCEDGMRKIAAKLFSPAPECCCAVNSLSCCWRGALEFPASWKGCGITDAEGNPLPVQEEEGRLFASVNLPPLSFTTFRKGKAHSSTPSALTGNVLENRLIRYEFSSNGQLISAYDKVAEREVLSAPGNRLSLYHDYPAVFDAWDVEIYTKRELCTELAGTREAGRRGEVFSMLEFCYHTGSSELRQKVVLQPDSRRLDFITEADWYESHKLLQVAFPLAFSAEQAAYDIPYGRFQRSTADNTSWEQAKFEVCGQKYADLSCGTDYGAALLNDCKYGYCVKDGVLQLSLLRATKYPDYFADQGKHVFTYSFLPHAGSLNDSSVLPEAAVLNRKPFLAVSSKAGTAQTLCRLHAESVALTVLKKAEKEDVHILRLVEQNGGSSRAELEFTCPVAEVRESDLVEWNFGEALPLSGNRIVLQFKPFEIKTLRVRMP